MLLLWNALLNSWQTTVDLESPDYILITGFAKTSHVALRKRCAFLLLLAFQDAPK